MKGVIFNLLEDVVSEEHGDDMWDALLDDAGLDGTYTSLGSYPDTDLRALLEAVTRKTGQSEDDVLRWFGQRAIPKLSQVYPHFFEGHDLRGFLLTLNDIIHAEVVKLYPGAEVPIFEYKDGPGRTLIIVYRSQRQLCPLAEGFILGASGHFGEPVSVSQSTCMRDGADWCTIECSFGEGS